QGRLGLAHPLGKDQDRLATSQCLGGGGEERRVPRRVAATLQTTVHRQGDEEPEERADQRIAEERRLRHRDQAARDRRQQQHAVYQCVVVIGRDDQWARSRDALGAHHVHPPVEDGGEEPGQRTDGAVRCGRAWAAQSVTRRPPSPPAAFQPRRLVIASRSAEAASASPWTTYVIPGGRLKPASPRKISSRSAWAEYASLIMMAAPTGTVTPSIFTSVAPSFSSRPRVPAA